MAAWLYSRDFCASHISLPESHSHAKTVRTGYMAWASRPSVNALAISSRRTGVIERLCAMEPRLRLEKNPRTTFTAVRIPPQAGFEPMTASDL